MVHLSCNWSSSSHSRYSLWLVGLGLVCWCVVHCFTLCAFWKPRRWTYNVVYIRILNFMSSNRTIILWEQPKTFFCTKGEGTVDPRIVKRWFKKFQLGCKKLDDQVRSSRPKTIDFEPVFQAVNLMSSTWRVSGEFCIPQSSMVYHLHSIS